MVISNFKFEIDSYLVCTNIESIGANCIGFLRNIKVCLNEFVMVFCSSFFRSMESHKSCENSAKSVGTPAFSKHRAS